MQVCDSPCANPLAAAVASYEAFVQVRRMPVEVAACLHCLLLLWAKRKLKRMAKDSALLLE